MFRSGFGGWEWLAVVALVSGLIIAAVVLAPWKMRFAIDANDLYGQLYVQAADEAAVGTLSWLAAAGFVYQSLRVDNAPNVARMPRLSAALGGLMVTQTILWLAALGLD